MNRRICTNFFKLKLNLHDFFLHFQKELFYTIPELWSRRLEIQIAQLNWSAVGKMNIRRCLDEPENLVGPLVLPPVKFREKLFCAVSKLSKVAGKIELLAWSKVWFVILVIKAMRLFTEKSLSRELAGKIQVFGVK